MTIHKRIVTDENRRPVAVQIDYADWLEIERQLGLQPSAEAPVEREAESGKDLDALLEGSRGIWKSGDGLEYQRRIRAEWTRPWDSEAQDETKEDG